MKNKVSDVRNHLVAVMEALNDESATPDERAAAIERAKAMSNLSAQFVAGVRVEIDAARLMHETGLLPSAVDSPQDMDALPGSSAPRLVYDRKRRA